MIRMLLAAACLALSGMAPALAQSTDDLVNALTPPVNNVLGANHLGIGVFAKENDPGPEKVLELIEKTEAATISVEINFAFGSSELTEDSKTSIDKVAAAINDPRLKDYKFLVGGHTDAKGPDEVNDPLARDRAQKVVDYLAYYDQVDPTRLVPYGFGKHQLKNPADPYAAENRRVQFVTLQ